MRIEPAAITQDQAIAVPVVDAAGMSVMAERLATCQQRAMLTSGGFRRLALVTGRRHLARLAGAKG